MKKTLNHPKADAEKRALFKKRIAQHKKEKHPIVYIDDADAKGSVTKSSEAKSGFAKDMPRTHGYSQRGERCFGTHDWNAWGRENVIGALLGTNLIAYAICNFNIDTDVFNTWVVNFLIPNLPQKFISRQPHDGFNFGIA